MKLIFVLAITLLIALPAAARTINVTTEVDVYDLYDNKCSLREALSAVDDGITLADAACGGTGDLGKDIISLPLGSYALVEPKPPGADQDAFWGDLDIYSEVELIAPVGTIIEAGLMGAARDGGRVLEIHPGARVILRNLIIKGGNEAFGGGGIKNNGWLALDNVVVTQNSAGGAGGGIATYRNSELYLLDSTVSVNTSRGTDTTWHGGGGIWAEASSRVGVTNSTISNNEAYYSGGGILTNAASASGGWLEITNSTVSGNNARAKGGGIYHAGDGGVTLSNATITSNTSNSDDTTDNDGSGGGIANAGSGNINLWNTILAGNQNLFTNTAPLTSDCSGTLLSQGGNIINIVGACLITDVPGTGTDLLGTDPLLNGLADNGGPTHTHDLQTGSPAKDGGNPLGCSRSGSGYLSTDQRGYIRPSGTRCDIGAVEFQYPASRYIVDTNKDDGTGCTLRDALTSIMNGSPVAGCTDLGSTGVATIEFDPSVTGTILLGSNLPAVTESLHIQGPGSGILSVSGQGSYRSGLSVDDPGNTATVLVENLAFINGFSIISGAAFSVSDYDALELKNVLVDANESNSCIAVHGHLIITNSTVSNCIGRGIFANNGSLEITDSSISDNVSAANGGGISLAASTMNATNIIFSGNVATQGGGGLYIDSGNLRINVDRCTFTGNSAGYGGGILLTNGELSVQNSLLTGNSATDATSGGDGGGILVSGPKTVFSTANTTFSGNSAVGNGGGLALRSGSVDLANITVTNNTADSDNSDSGYGGGLAVVDASVALRNSILSGNWDLSPATMNPDCFTNTNLFVSSGFNLVGSQSGCQFATWSNDDIFGAKLLLLPLADNGGPTLTHAILQPSPAVDGADPQNGCSWDHDANPATARVGLSTDQRGFNRYIDGDDDAYNVCDIGAYEYNKADPKIKGMLCFPVKSRTGTVSIICL